uniref:Vesicle coat complex copii subunit sec24/subunit sfb2 n=2 Tax=Macrostomum lignano TaxID=282301 RepID=A0A1I8IAW3_9PLAT
QQQQQIHPGMPNGSNGAGSHYQSQPAVWPPPAQPAQHQTQPLRPPMPPPPPSAPSPPSGAPYGPPRPPMPPQQQPRPPMPPPPGPYQPQSQPQQQRPPMPPQPQAPPTLRPPGPPQPPAPMPPSGIPPTARLDGSLRSSQDGSTQRHVNLLQDRQLLSPTEGIEVLKPSVKHYPGDANCDPEVMCCTLNVIPSTSSLLQKARLPLGLLLHPFKDLRNLPVIQASVIVRCRSCRTYINPFVQLIDQRRWRCNVCYRTNDLPDEFQYDPVSKVYGEPSRRPEVRSATVEFIAPQEYTVRPPPPATYVMLFDVSLGAAYLSTVCQVLLRSLDRLPGDARTQLAIMTFNGFLHLYQLDGPRPRMLVLPDLDEAAPPLHDGLLVTVSECRDAIAELLETLPIQEFPEAPGSCLGTALQMAYKLAQSYGGRVTAFVASLPSLGPGALQNRDDPSTRAGKPSSGILQPGTDFYKRLALDCCGVQLGIDLFCLAPQPVDLPSLLPASLFSSGDFFHYPDMAERPDEERARLATDFNRYVTRKIGFEAVMRLRCTKGISISAFHGSCFVRSTDLLSLPTVNPDAGFGIQLALEDSLADVQLAVCQAALLYTSAKGERRIRVHTLAVPVTSRLEDVFRGADQRAVAGLLALMATDRTIGSSLTDAREALVNAAVDLITAYGNCALSSGQRIGSLCVPYHLRLLPALVLALMKCTAFRLGVSTRLDERAGALAAMKLTPLRFLLMRAYPDLYALHPSAWPPPPPQQQQQQQQEDQKQNNQSVSDDEIDEPPRLHLSAQFLERGGLYLLDAGRELLLFVFSGMPQAVYQQLFAVDSFQQIRDGQLGLPELDNPLSERVRGFVECLQSDRPFGAPLTLLREDGRQRGRFTRYLVEDRSEGGASQSYQEFLQTLQKM